MTFAMMYLIGILSVYAHQPFGAAALEKWELELLENTSRPSELFLSARGSIRRSEDRAWTESVMNSPIKRKRTLGGFVSPVQISIMWSIGPN